MKGWWIRGVIASPLCVYSEGVGSYVEMCEVAITEMLLKGELMWSRSWKDGIRRVDRERLLERCVHSVDENVKRARRTFFHYGSIGVFQGDLSPLSSRSILEYHRGRAGSWKESWVFSRRC